MSLESSIAVSVEPDTVGFTFTVTNGGTEPITLHFPSGKLADIVVCSASGEVWRWSDGRLFTQAVESRSLTPGESLIHEAAWSDPTSGTYTAEAMLTATDVDVGATAEFVVG